MCGQSKDIYSLLGQLLMIGIPGEGLIDDFCALIRDYRIGNFIILGRNCEGGKEELRRLCLALRDLCRELALPQPFIAVDQEGGRVQRLRPPHFEKIAPNSLIKTTIDVQNQARLAHTQLHEVGINVNLAPVLDMNFDNKEGVLKDRCYGKNLDELITLGISYIRCIQSLGTYAVCKHFPGLGLARNDPHVEISILDVDEETLELSIKPFLMATRIPVFGIMTTHVLVLAIDDQIATFSPRICKGIIRDRFNFNGIVFTDDLDMGAIRGNFSLEEASIMALRAGHDICLICHSWQEASRILNAIKDEYYKDSWFSKTINKSYERIMSFKGW